MPSMRHRRHQGEVHESVVIQLSRLPETTQARSLVTGSGDDRDGFGRRADPSSGVDGPHAQARLTAWVRGRVQGVGFRWWVRRHALELGLLGAAENLVD